MKVSIFKRSGEFVNQYIPKDWSVILLTHTVEKEPFK